MGECINENTFRDWHSDPKKLGDPIKPIEVSYPYIDLAFFILSYEFRLEMLEQFLYVLAEAGSHRLLTAEVRVRM
jgi:hypothetical protein